MKKSTQNKIVKQIYRLAEKQYRKGFQQGFYACEEKRLKKEDADEFRWKGSIENYSKVVNPFMGHSEVASERILAEIAMSDMDELNNLILKKYLLIR